MQRDRQIRHQRLARQPLQRRQRDRRSTASPAAATRAKPCSSASIRSAFIVVVVVVQRFAHPHQHDVERPCRRRSSAAASTRTCPAISPAVRFRTRPILPVRQNPQAIAHPTCVEMQKVMAGVSGMNTASIWRPSARRSRNFSVPSLSARATRPAGVAIVKSRASAARSALREIGHRVELGHAAPVDPREDLARTEAFVSRGRRRRASSSARSSSARSAGADTVSRAISMTSEHLDLTAVVQRAHRRRAPRLPDGRAA